MLVNMNNQHNDLLYCQDGIAFIQMQHATTHLIGSVVNMWYEIDPNEYEHFIVNHKYRKYFTIEPGFEYDNKTEWNIYTDVQIKCDVISKNTMII